MPDDVTYTDDQINDALVTIMSNPQDRADKLFLAQKFLIAAERLTDSVSDDEEPTPEPPSESPPQLKEVENMSVQILKFDLTNRSRMRVEMLEGREHLVVPAVMIVEGVLAGSAGPLFYPRDELAKAPGLWNHKPLLVGHPANGGSANDTAEINSRKIGIMLNTRWTAPKLVTEAWIDTARANRIDKRIIDNLTSGQTIEVSTGVQVGIEQSPGKFGEITYNGIARNYQPDHLAILVDEKGACPVSCGCGLMARNEAVENAALYAAYEAMVMRDFNSQALIPSAKAAFLAEKYGVSSLVTNGEDPMPRTPPSFGPDAPVPVVDRRRRAPLLWELDAPAPGAVQNNGSHNEAPLPRTPLFFGPQKSEPPRTVANEGGESPLPRTPLPY